MAIPRPGPGALIPADPAAPPPLSALPALKRAEGCGSPKAGRFDALVTTARPRPDPRLRDLRTQQPGVAFFPSLAFPCFPLD